MSRLPRLPTALTALSIAAILCGCGVSAEPGLEADLPRWTLVEELRIGGADDPEASFTTVIGVAVAADGRVFVADWQQRLIHAYDQDGRLLRRIGGDGDGPGEFRSLDDFGILGDTLYATSAALSRISYFTLDGAFLGTEIRSVVLEDHPRGYGPRRLRPDGSALLTFEPLVGPPGTLLIDPRDEVVDTLYFEADRGLHILDGAVHYRPSNPFTPQRSPRVFLSPDASRYATFTWTPPHRGVGRYTLTSIEIGGDTLFSRTFVYRPEPYPREYVDSVMASVSDRIVQAIGWSRSRAEAFVGDNMHPRDYRPPPAFAAYSDEGELWMTRRSAESSDWFEILSRDGVPIARLAQVFAVPHVIRGDRVWAVTRDEYLVPSVVRYRIERAGPH